MAELSAIARERRALRATYNDAEDEAALLRHQESFMKAKQEPSARLIRAPRTTTAATAATTTTTSTTVTPTGPAAATGTPTASSVAPARDRVQLGDITPSPARAASTAATAGAAPPRVSRFKQQQMAAKGATTPIAPAAAALPVPVHAPAAVVAQPSVSSRPTINDSHHDNDDNEDNDGNDDNGEADGGDNNDDGMDEETRGIVERQEGMLGSVIYERDVTKSKISAPLLPAYTNHGFPVASNRTSSSSSTGRGMPSSSIPVVTPLPSSIRATPAAAAVAAKITGGRQSLFARARAAERNGTGVTTSSIPSLTTASSSPVTSSSSLSVASSSSTSSLRSSEAAKISSDNDARISNMSDDAIRAAQAELHQILNPQLIDVLRSGRHRTAPAKTAAQLASPIATVSSSSSTVAAPVSSPLPSPSTVAAPVVSPLMDKDAKHIDEENDKILNGMSNDEIKRAQDELYATFPAHLLDVIRTRRHKTAPAKGAAAAIAALQTGSAAIAASPLRNSTTVTGAATATAKPITVKGSTSTSSSAVASSGSTIAAGVYQTPHGWAPPERKVASVATPATSSSVIVSDGTSSASSLAIEDREAWMNPSDDTKLSPAAKKAIELKKKTAADTERIWGEWRVDFSGRPIGDIDGMELPTHLGLHHHGAEPDRAGYTMREILHLTRSTIPSQRSMALRILSHVFIRVRNGDYHNTSLPGAAATITTASHMSFSQSLMIYLLSLGTPTLVRVAVDDHHLTTLISSLHTLAALINVVSDTSCIVVHNDGSIVDALLWRGHELVNTGPVLGSDQLPQAHDDQKEDSKLHEDWCAVDLISGMLRMQLLSRIAYILSVLVNPLSPSSTSWSLLDPILTILMAIARHSSVAAKMIADTPNMIMLLSALCTTPLVGATAVSPSVGSTLVASSKAAVPNTPPSSSSAVVDTRCLTIVRLLCQSDRAIVQQFHHHGLLTQLKRYIILANGVPGTGGALPSRAPSELGLRLSIESLIIWRVSLSYGIDADSFLDLFPCLCACIADFSLASSSSDTTSTNVTGLMLLQMRAVYNVFEALMHSSMAAERISDAIEDAKAAGAKSSPPSVTPSKSSSAAAAPLPSSVVVQSVHWSHVVNTVEHALRSLEAIVFTPSIVTSSSSNGMTIDPLLCVAVSGAMHFVATYHCYLPHRDEYDPFHTEPQISRHASRIWSRWKQSPLLIAALTSDIINVSSSRRVGTIISSSSSVIPVISFLPTPPLRLPYDIAAMMDICSSTVRWLHAMWKLELNRDVLAQIIHENKTVITPTPSSKSTAAPASSSCSASLCASLYDRLHSISNGTSWRHIRRVVNVDGHARVSDRMARETNIDEMEYDLIPDWPNDRLSACVAYDIITLLTLIYEDRTPSDMITRQLYVASLQLLPALAHSGNQSLALTLARSLTFDGDQYRTILQQYGNISDTKMDTRRIDAALHDVWAIFGHYLVDTTTATASSSVSSVASSSSMVSMMTTAMMAAMSLPYSTMTSSLAIQPPSPDYILPFDSIPSPYLVTDDKNAGAASYSSDGAATHNTTWLLLPLKRSRWLVDIALPTAPPSLMPGTSTDHSIINGSGIASGDDTSNMVISVELKQRVLQSYLSYITALYHMMTFNGNNTVTSRALMEVFTLGGDIYHDSIISSLLSHLFTRLFALPTADTTTVRASIIGDSIMDDNVSSPTDCVPSALATMIPLTVATITGNAHNNFDFDAPHMRIWGRSVFPFLKDLVEQFVSESLADATYSQCLLLFLRQQYPVDYRKVIWAELQDDFQALAPHAPLDLQGYLYPLETRRDMLQLFETHISGSNDTARLTWTRHAFMYTIAIHHVHHYLLYDGDDIAILEPRWARLIKLMKSNPVAYNDICLYGGNNVRVHGLLTRMSLRYASEATSILLPLAHTATTST